MAKMQNYEPVTVTFKAQEWHVVLREVVYVASTTEKYLAQLAASADPKRDAYVLALSDGLRHVVAAADRVSEILSDAQARPVPR